MEEQECTPVTLHLKIDLVKTFPLNLNTKFEHFSIIIDEKDSFEIEFEIELGVNISNRCINEANFSLKIESLNIFPPKRKARRLITSKIKNFFTRNLNSKS